MICPWCKTEFEVKPWPVTRAKFCSRKCVKADWRDRHREQVREKNRRYVEIYRERRLETTRRYDNSEHGKTAKRVWYAANKARLIAARAARYHSDPLFRKVNTSRSVANRKLKRSGRPRVCVMCGSRARLHCHHVDFNPLNNKLENLTWLCHWCHMFIHRSDAIKPSDLSPDKASLDS